MNTTTRPAPDAILAHVRLMRLTDRLLAVAEDVRRARDDLQTALATPPATEHRKGEGGRRDAR